MTSFFKCMFSSAPENYSLHRLIQALNDCFLVQHVLQPTRYSEGEASNILDLVLTNEEGMINEIDYLAGLGNSDHVVLRFEVACYSYIKETDVPRYDFRRADFSLLNSKLQDTDWMAMQEINVNNSYEFFKHAVSLAVDDCIPRAKPRQKKNLSINGRANQLKKRKETLWHQYAGTKDPVDHARYKRCQNELRSLTRNLRREFEQHLVWDIKNNPKAFWQYSNSRVKTKAVIGQGVDITIPVTCSVFEVDPMTSQCTRGVPRLKFRHKIHEMWVIISFVAIASQ